MTMVLAEESMAVIPEYAYVPITFTVDRVLDVTNRDDRSDRFYERQGCQLRAVNRAAYPQLPDEIQLLWYRDLAR